MAVNQDFNDTNAVHAENYFHKHADQVENEKTFLAHMYLAAKLLQNWLLLRKEVMYG